MIVWPVLSDRTLVPPFHQQLQLNNLEIILQYSFIDKNNYNKMLMTYFDILPQSEKSNKGKGVNLLIMSKSVKNDISIYFAVYRIGTRTPRSDATAPTSKIQEICWRNLHRLTSPAQVCTGPI